MTSKPAAKNPSVEPSSRQRIKVALVEDQTTMRENWTRLINSFPDFTCVCACVSAEEALTHIPRAEPDVVLMDIFLPRMSGIECTARLKMKLPDVQIVMLTAMDNQEMSYETVCTHLKRVFKKLHVNSRTEAAILYMNSKMSEQRPDTDSL